MSANDPRAWMWTEACALLDRAERMHRQFFEPDLSGTAGASWSPPVDVYETDSEVWIVAAIPGIEPEDLAIAVDGDTLVLSGRRSLPAATRTARIHRLEIPHGRFERRLRLISSGLRLSHRELANGCLVLGLSKQF